MIKWVLAGDQEPPFKLCFTCDFDILIGWEPLQIYEPSPNIPSSFPDR